MSNRRSKAVKTITDLTPKQKAFVDILVSNWGQMSKADAVRQAGYETKSPNGAHEIGSRLTNPDKNPHVVRYLETKLLKEKSIYEKDKLKRYKRFEYLSNKAENKGQIGVAVNAEYRSGQMANMFVNQTEVKHVGLEGMSREQLEKRLGEIEKKIGEAKNIIDITPKETS
jgi:phage terminase small subunit|tara:strand:+ start:8579 stop:9088 length:510 start_codon:yes stop_codon:yes gene_type:complete